MSRPSEQSQYRLLVEGPDDLFTVVHIMKRAGYDWDDDTTVRPFVHSAGGIDKVLDEHVLRSSLKTHLKLGVIIDADYPPQNRYNQASAVLSRLGIRLPTEPVLGGLILDMNTGGYAVNRFGLWLMPDNLQRGRLEDFVAALIPDHDRVWPHAENATAQAISLGAPLSQNDRLKGQLHSWLAWQNDPGLPFGSAIDRTILSKDPEIARAFVAWFRRLFA